jgi:tRNA(Arg) A34 adenosine deaminase TadA
VYYEEHVLTRRETRAVNRAIKSAEKSDNKFRHGSVIMKGSRITCGYNKLKNDPLNAYNPKYISIHAEHDALRIHSNPYGATCVVVRLNNQDDLRYSAPCPMCVAKLREAGLKRVIFSDHNSSSGFSRMTL